MRNGEPPSPSGQRLSTSLRRVRAFTNSIVRRLPVIIPVVAVCFFSVSFSVDTYAAWQGAHTPQNTNDAETVAFTLSNYLKLDSLQPADTQADFGSVAFAGQNVGGVANSSPFSQAQRQHVVEKGETISSIATLYNLHIGSIILANKDLQTSDIIHEGQVLIIPDADASDTALEKEWNDRQQRSQVASTSKSKTSTKSRVSAAVSADFTTLIQYRPISYRYESQGFSSVHPGVDLVANIGTPIYAVKSGCIVVQAGGWNGGYGNTIILNIGNGYAVRYAHLSAFSGSYGSGDCVSAGQLLGYSGNTGRSTGPHLHFEIRRNGIALDPNNFGI